MQTLDVKTTISPLDDPNQWLHGQSMSAPLSKEEIVRVQTEIDSIIGTTRGESILKLVWNGDVDYWERFYIEWNVLGEPVKEVRRPLVLYKSVWSDDKTKLIKDIFVPRWLLLRRTEPEQYQRTWEKFSYMVSRKFTRLEYDEIAQTFVPKPQKILFRPPDAPKNGWYRWFMTIGEHTACCCMKAASQGGNCYGRYAHPRAAFQELGQIAKARETVKDNPFASGDEISQRTVERGNNNYYDQSVRQFETDRDMVLDRPEQFAPFALVESGASLATLKQAADERLKREYLG